MRISKRSAALLCTISAAALTVASEAAAQAADEAAVSEIVVTAQRRSEVLENVPMAVTVVTGDALERSNVDSFMELGKLTAGLQMDYAGSVPGVALHGISTQISGFSTEPNVALYIDGFYNPNMVTMASDLASVSSVQVLKGPQGALYGRNATGGAVLINTLGPSRTQTGKFDATIARWDDYILNGYVAGPINDRVRYSLSAHFREADSYMRKISPTTIGATIGPAAPIQEYGARAKVEVDITDDFTGLLALNYSHVADYRANIIQYFGHLNTALLAPPPARATKFGEAGYNRQQRLWAMTYEPNLKLTYTTPLGTLTSYTGYAHRIVVDEVDFDGSYRDAQYFRVKYNQDTFQQTLDYNIDAIEKLNLVVGASYYHDLLKNGPGITNYFPQTYVQTKQVTKSLAGYIDGTYQLTDKLSLGAGGRITYDKRSAYAAGRTGAGVPIINLVKGSDDWTRFTPRATLRYEISPRTNVYGSVTRGFRSGVFNSSGPPANGLPYEPIDPETITAYEVGFKTAGSKVRFSTSAFYYDYKDLQVSTVVPNPINPLQIVTVLLNAPGAKIYGLDTEVIVNPVERLTVRGGLALLHAEFKDFRNAVGTGVNATNTLNVTNQVQDWTGKRLARAPKYSGNVSVEYDAPIAYGSLLLSANMNFTSRYAISNPSLYGPLAPVELQGKQRFTQAPYALFNAQATWTDPSDRYSVTVFGTNLGDKTYRMGYNGSVFGDYSAPAEPRSYGVKVGYKY